MKLDAESYLKTGSNELRVLEYRLGKLSFGINILKVSKIVNELVNFTRMPDSHTAVSGVFRDINHLVPVVDLSVLFGIDENEVKKDKVIVTEFFGMLTGFWVERVDWIHHFLWEDVIDAENVFAGIDHRYVIGIVKPTEERMVLLLDYETILLDLCPNLHTRAVRTFEGAAIFDGKRVLIAEDSPAVRSMLVNEMTELGFEVVDVSDGQQAWKAFEDKPFDLVISDVEMPQMDGLALTLKIRQSGQPDTPVIVYSSIGDIGMKARATFLKADAHITKLNLNQLVMTADKLLRGEKIDNSIGGREELEEVAQITVPLR
ncbi:MAG: chemotaxis protein CheV [candidate division Zixibacteria bacterium]|nr:chemotaxis protein CheV [candidate division Zixibacteria bacterium]